MKYDGIVLISDLDGTLLDEDRKLSKDNIDAIRHFTENGGRFGIATGRMALTTGKRFPELPVNIPSIFSNGALIYDFNEKRVEKASLLTQGLESFFQGFLDQFPELGLEINTCDKAYIIRGHEILTNQLAREGLEGIEAGWDKVPAGWYKILLAASHECLARVKEGMEAQARPDIGVVFSEWHLLDIMASNVSKGSALDYLREKYGWEKVVAVGDNENDLALVKSADIGIAVGNATEDVKKAANRVIGPNRIPCMPEVLSIINGLLA